MTRVIFRDIDKVYPGVGGMPGSHAVKALNLDIEPGTLVTLLGPSGCGKTTTLRMLAGFELPTSGQLMVDDRDMTLVPVNARGIGMVFQSYALFPHMSVRENVGFGLRVMGLGRSENEERVARVLDLMHLTQYADRAPAQLSGGQQQRVALARAVVIEPKVLLFDEPLSNLDAQLRERMRDELRQIQQRLGITSLYVTHDQSEAMAISDRVVVMRDGVIEQNDTPANIYARPRNAFVAGFMGRANILNVRITQVSGQEARGELGGAAITIPLAGHDMRPGDEVACVVRPEQVQMDETGTEAEVQRVVFQGGYVEYGVSIAGQSCNVIDHAYQQSHIRNVGDTLRLSFQRAAVWPLGHSDRTI